MPCPHYYKAFLKVPCLLKKITKKKECNEKKNSWRVLCFLWGLMKTRAHQGKGCLPSFKWASLFLLRHKRHLRGRCLGNRKLHCPPLTTSGIPLPPCLKRSVAMKFDWFLSLLMMGISCHITMMFMMIILSPFLKFLFYFFFLVSFSRKASSSRRRLISKPGACSLLALPQIAHPFPKWIQNRILYSKL